MLMFSVVGTEVEEFRLFGNFRGSRPDNASVLPHLGIAGPAAPICGSEQVFATENPEDPEFLSFLHDVCW